MDLDGIRGRWTRKCRPDIHRGDDEDVGSKSSLSVKSSSSINSSDSGWSWDVPKEARLNPEIEYGEMTDDRDGQTYKTVEICDEDKLLCQTWMAENLNYDYNVGTAKSTCYENEQDSCSKYGRLYSWSAAMDSAAMFSENGEGCGFYGYTCRPRGSIRGVCPDGWHLPSQTEWDTLFAAVGESTSSTMFKSLTGWESYSGVPAGSDVYGFSALPAGYWNYYNGNFEHVGQYAVFWSSNIYDSNEAYGVGLIYSDEDAIQSELYVSYAVSVRCLKNTDDANSTSSVNSSNSGWSWDVPKEARLNPEITYGTMTDTRDGKTYRTVEIGDQVWMAENLNYADSVKTISLKGKSWCFDNKDANCDVTGRFYTWAAAIDSAALANDTENPQTCGYGQSCDRLTSTALAEAPIQGICPSGWHLPSKTEWQVLFTAVGGSGNAGKALKSGSGWYSNGNGTDAYGFSALPAGSGDYDGDFYGAGRNAYFWSATRYEYSCYYAFYMDLDYNYEYAYLGYGRKFNALSIRCLKDD